MFEKKRSVFLLFFRYFTSLVITTVDAVVTRSTTLSQILSSVNHKLRHLQLQVLTKRAGIDSIEKKVFPAGIPERRFRRGVVNLFITIISEFFLSFLISIGILANEGLSVRLTVELFDTNEENCCETHHNEIRGMALFVTLFFMSKICFRLF